MSQDDSDTMPCWGYLGDDGPERWGRMHPDWRLCDEGQEQSPIALPSVDALPLGERPVLHYQAGTGTLSDYAHAVRVDMEPGSQLMLGDHAWTLKQFHFHTPSEHLWADAADAAELHLVHGDGAGNAVVLGVALRLEAAQALPDSLWEQLLAAEVRGTLRLDPAELVPNNCRVISYSGSLTTPPCTEGVRWLLTTEPMAISAESLRWLKQKTGENARPVQPLGDRAVHLLS